MADKISVLIQSILEAPTQENINKVKSQIQSAIGNVTSKTGSKGIKLLNQEEIDIYIKKLQNEIQRIQFRTPKVFDNEAVKKELNNLNIEFDKLRNGETTTKKVSLQMDNLKTQIVGASSALKNVNKDGYSFTQMLELAAKKVAIWGLSTTLVYGVWRQIKQGISYISELDNSLNEIRIVTNKTQQEVNNLALSYNKLAKEMNVTTREIASTAADLFRQGLDEGQVEERMKAIIQYAKISGISLEESNKIITATANATGESVQKIIDVFAYLGDMTASGAEEIGEALQRVASTAENSGVSLEKAASWIATISSITRESASVIGNSLKSIISRYEQIKAKGFNEEDATQMNDVTKALQAVGIVAVDAQGQLRPIAEVLDELGAKWDGLTNNEKAYIATTLAGTYQRNRLITLLNNYNDSLKNYEIALNSAGTAEQKFAIYQDSVQAKLDKLSATWEEFWQKSLNSDLIKGTIQALTYLIDTFGNLRTVLSLVATGFALWKGTQITKWFRTSKVAAEGLRVAIIKTRGAIIGMTEAEIAAKTATTGLTLSWNALKVAFLSNPIGFVVTAFTTLIAVMDIFNQKQEEMRQKIEESAQEAKEQSDRIAELMGRYNELIHLVGEDKKGEDKNARDQLQSIQSELVKTLGLEKEAIDLVNDSRGESIKKIREEAIERLKANENALIAAKNLAEEEKKNKKGSSSFLGLGGYEYVGSPILSDKENKAFNLMKTISGLRVDRSALGTFILMADYMTTAEERAEILETALKALKDAGLENTNVFNQLARSQQGYNDVINKAKEATDAVNKSIAEQLILQKENEIGIPKTVQEFENFRKAILDNSSGTEDFKRVLNELLSQQYPQFAKQTEDNSNLILGLSKSYENLSKSISNTFDDLKTLNQVIADVRNGQSLSAEQILDLIEKYNLSADAIKKTTDGYTVELSALENVRKAKIQTALDSIEAEKKHALAVKEQVESRLKNYGLEIEQLKNIAAVKAKLAELADKEARRIADEITGGYSDAGARNRIYEQVYADVVLAGKTLAEIEELEKKSKLLISILNDRSYGVSSSKSSSSKSTTEIYEAEINQFQQLEDALSKVNDQIKRNEILTDLAEEKDKINLLSKRIDLYKQEQEILHQLAEARRNVIQQNVEKLQGLGFDVSYDRNANELLIRNIERLNQLKGKDAEATNELRKSTEELIQTTQSLNDANRQASTQYIQLNKDIKDLKQQQEEYAQKLIESYQNYVVKKIEEEIDAWEDAKKKAQEAAQEKIDAIQLEIDRLQERNEQLKIEEERQERLIEIAKQKEILENVKKQKNVRIYQNGQWVWVADPKKVKEETDKLKDLQEDYAKWEAEHARQAEIQRLRNQIKQIQTDLKITENYYDNKIKLGQKFLKKYKKQWEEQKEEVTSYEALIQKLSEIEQSVYETRLQQLDDFVTAWNALVSRMRTPSAVDDSVDVEVSSSTASSTKTSTTKDSSTKNNATATLPNGQKVPVSIENGRTVTKGLPVGTVVHTAGGNYKIKEVKSDGSYTGQKVNGFSDGGWVDYTGLAVVHGTPSKPEAFLKHDDAKLIYNAANFLKNIANNIKMSSINLPEIKIPFFSNNNLVAKPTENHYHFENLNIQANDPNEMFRKLNMIIQQYT